MELLVETTLEDEGHTFRCPEQEDSDLKEKCGFEWTWNMIQAVAEFTISDIARIEYQIGKHYLTRVLRAKRCPECNIFLVRQLSSNCRHTTCPICSKDNSNYAFCWSCERPWQSEDRENLNDCGNKGCDSNDTSTLNQLLKSTYFDSRSTIGNRQSCPSVRACPSCCTAISHDGGCQVMCCEFCEHIFCFICLSTGNMCINATARCDIAPLQHF